MIYLDAAATAPPRREVLEAMWPYLTTEFGNPSSSHSAGESAARALTAARETAARVLGCRPGEIIFTSGGTEADNLAVKGLALAGMDRMDRRDRLVQEGTGAPPHLVSTAVEHPAVLESLDYLQRRHGFRVTLLSVDAAGMVDPEEAAAALTPETVLCSVMYANNEVGTIQPVRKIAARCRAAGVPFHTDAVQAGGWLDLNVTRLGVDALSLSGHKLGTPKGIGLLYLRGVPALEPVMHGGGQERGRRSGTENVAGAVGMAAALALAAAERDATARHTATLRNRLIDTVLRDVPGALLTGHRSERLPGHASFCFPGTSGEAVLLELERAGVLCSSGSACAAGSDEPSAVLTAMGLDRATAQTAVRFTFTAALTEDDVERAARAVADAVGAVGGLAPGPACSGQGPTSQAPASNPRLMRQMVL
ncbi:MULTISPECIES: cysteine desulfurase family protein [unclassified Arthrobacter]|uniref:cysteine desulfurase family protein n=1 Tax=unclassified Arthrobacter TaxID=235627 RepID=UPI000CE3EF78|nr:MULTISPECIES: cysteine desulfurase family protein [unclassified Arthrobacter]